MSSEITADIHAATAPFSIQSFTISTRYTYEEDAMKYCALAFILLFPVVLHASSTQVDVIRYNADITVDVEQKSLSAIVTLQLTNCTDIELKNIPLDLVGLTVSSVTVDHVAATWTHDFGVLTIFPDMAIRKGDTVSVRIIYGGLPQSEEGQGPVFGEVSYCLPRSNNLEYLCTTSHWLPTNNLICDKATYDLTFEVNSELYAVSIGTLADVAAMNGHARYRWVEDTPTPPHAVVWAIADYVRLQQTVEGITADYYVLRKDEARAMDYFSTLPDMITLYTSILGDWPLGNIGFCWVPEGAVAGQGMIPFSTKTWESKAGAAEAHELAHQWFGNCLTPSDVSENWLSEGFATYFEWLYRAERDGEDGIDGLVRKMIPAYRDEIAVGEGAIPLHDFRSYIEDNYPGTIHFKGAIVLNMLRHVMGEERFHAGLRDYVQEYAVQSVTTAVFQHAMEKHSLTPLNDFIQQWVYRPGWPVYALTRFCEQPDGPFKLCVKQTQGNLGWPYFSMPLEIDLYTVSGDTVRISRQGQAVENDMIIVDEIQDRNVVGWKFDPDGWLLREISIVSDVERVPAQPAALTLHPVYPQPLLRGYSTATLPVTLRNPLHLRVELRDMLGRLQRVISDREYGAGTHRLAVETQGLARGCYQLLVQSAGETTMTQVLLQ